MFAFFAMASAGRAVDDGDAFLADIRALTHAPHRLSGTPEGHAAADYIQRRLREMGVSEIFPLEMQTWQTQVGRCQLSAGGKTINLLPLRPDILVSPVTPPDGLSGPLLYAGRGETADYGTRTAEGAIVVLEYDSFDNWQRAFAMGAKAVVFIGSDSDTPVAPKHVGVPANFVRLYARPEALKTIDLRHDQPMATVVSQVPWESGTGINVCAFLPGAAPVFDNSRKPETVVLAANYDTFGVVPQDSPGARGAANVAALLDAARYFKKHPPRRNILLMFLDNQARYHQGAREVYSALMTRADLAKEVAEEHREQLDFAANVLQLISGGSQHLDGPPEIRNAAIDALKSQAEFIATDIQQQLLRIRVALVRDKKADHRELLAAKAKLAERLSGWDLARRALHKGAPGKIDPVVFSELRSVTLEQFRRRTRELEFIVRADGEAQRLRDRMDGGWIALHVDYNLSDGGPTWGVVVGDATQETMWGSEGTADNPGYYNRILAAFRNAATRLPEKVAPAAETLSDPTAGLRYATGKFAVAGSMAGTYGIYHLSLMTGNDGRWRDGHPADTLANLRWQTIRDFAAQAEQTLEIVTNSGDLSLPRTFADQSVTALPRWSHGTSYGNFAGLAASGSISEDRPAAGAMMAVWGYWPSPPRIWDVQGTVGSLPFFDRIVMEKVDTGGRFKLVGLRKDLFKQYVTLGAMFDDAGNVNAISNQESLFTPTAGAVTRVNMVPAKGYAMEFPLLGEMEKVALNETDKPPFHALDAVTDADMLKARSLSGQVGETGFFYVIANSAIERMKIFQKMGPVLMNSSAQYPYGTGLPLRQWATPPASDRITAEDLWRLDESRLGILRAHGVNDVELEILHGRALRMLDRAAKTQSVEQKESAFAQSTLLSRRVYPGLRASMNDLVHGAVVLLLLTIPFAFAMERLVFCASSVYKRMGGFALLFIVTFALLYMMHPGFAIATTPMIIFLAFTIILLSCLVIFIVVRKFKDELRATQGQSGRLHRLEVSRMGTMLAAVNMGMSTMRRRKTRTVLTCVTVVLLTFTILSFASLTSGVGLRVVYEGPAGENREAGVLTRQVDYTEMPANLLPLLRGSAGENSLIAPHWWLARHRASETAFSVARADDGRAASFDSVMGIAPEELERWPQLAAVLNGNSVDAKLKALKNGGVFLPAGARDRLGLHVGDPVLLNGQQAFFAGVLNTDALQRLKHIDGRSVIPADFITAATLKPDDPLVEEKKNVEDMSQHDVVRLNPDQVCITSAGQVRSQGGRLHLLTIYLPHGVDAGVEGRKLAEMIPMPVWAHGGGGVERMIFTSITELHGGLALLVPVVLGGLIIFGTLLGSITDREKEIYTFSALGLAPAHVGFLFLAEAVVYAVVGGMGGQLLAQAVALAASSFAKAGLIHAPALNYSSSNALFAVAVVMATVIISAAYPAVRASRSANPGAQRAWKLPPPKNGVLEMVFPFTVSAYDITGVISFLAEHFRAHEDAGLGRFAAREVGIGRDAATGNLALSAHLALAPFDLGITQDFTLTATASEIPGVDEVVIRAVLCSGSVPDWMRSNRVFVQDLRRQFLLWRALSADMIENYRMQTLQTLGEKEAAMERTPELHTEIIA